MSSDTPPTPRWNDRPLCPYVSVLYAQKELVPMNPVIVPFPASAPKAIPVSPSPSSGPSTVPPDGVYAGGESHVPDQHVTRSGPAAVHGGGGSVHFVGRTPGYRSAYSAHHLAVGTRALAQAP